MFRLVSSAWGTLNYNNQGYHSPRVHWITSTGPASITSNTADKAAYILQEQKKQRDKARNQHEGHD
jgi:hypothetical protein